MGKSKPVFDELIGTNSFDKIFKNSIRDYYTYGFKSYNQLSKGNQTEKKRWDILSKVLGERWYFEKGKKGRNQITLKTMAHGADNPLDELYFLHNSNKIGDYLNYFLDLDTRSSFRGDRYALPADQDELYEVEGSSGVKPLEDADAIEFSIIDNWLNEIDRGTAALKTDRVVRINRQLKIWSRNTRVKTSSFRDKYTNLNNRTRYLYDLGVLADLRDDPKERNKWLRLQWEQYTNEYPNEKSQSSKRYFTNEKSGNHYWYRSPVTMERIINGLCEGADSGQEQGIVCDFKAMCDFFSQYYPMGSLGTMLSKRCDCMAEPYDKECFSFKHNYIQKTLYDYNLIDILPAIENRYLCLIEYSHGTNMRSFQEIIIPLEIRISVINGREYVLYYHIVKRRIMALRLEFIDKITVYSDVVSITKEKKDKSIRPDLPDQEEIRIEKNDMDRQVSIAKQMLPYIWGTDVSECIVEEQWRERLINVRIPVKYQMETEGHIERRLKKENRFQQNEGSFLIFPTKELRNWIRSFYRRVDVSSDTDIASFHIYSDVEAMWNVYFNKTVLPGEGADAYNKTDASDHAEYEYRIKGDIVPLTEGHDALFNELFSKYAVAFAKTVLSCSKRNGRADMDKILAQNIEKVFEYYSQAEIREEQLDLRDKILDSELVDKKGKSRFILENGDYLYDILPLTKIELRWLLTVLEDPLAHIFLTQSQIEAAKKKILEAPLDIRVFPLWAINYFDRYNLENKNSAGTKIISQSGRHSERELHYIRTIYQAMKEQTKLRIEYWNRGGKKKYASCCPVRIEYSRRDDIFRVWYVQNEKNEIRKINIPRVTKITVLSDKQYDKNEQGKKMKDLYDASMTSIKVEFYQGDRNLPDRILTEFSLWKKKCIYDVSSSKYTMTLYYSVSDEKEILIRLLSYGPYIRVVASEDNYVFSELKNRIVAQKDLILEKEWE